MPERARDAGYLVERRALHADVVPRSLAERMRGDSDSDGNGETRVSDLGVLPQHWSAIRLFQRCQLTYVGASGACLGIAATEIEAVLRLSGLPARRHRVAAQRIALCGRLAARAINEKREQATQS